MLALPDDEDQIDIRGTLLHAVNGASERATDVRGDTNLLESLYDRNYDFCEVDGLFLPLRRSLLPPVLFALGAVQAEEATATLVCRVLCRFFKFNVDVRFRKRKMDAQAMQENFVCRFKRFVNPFVFFFVVAFNFP